MASMLSSPSWVVPPPNVYRGAVQYKGVWLAPGSHAFQLYQDKKFKELDQHNKALYVGPYSKEVVLAHTDGNTTLTMKKQIREGVVVKSYDEIRNQHYGRKIAKSVSEAYLLRKGEVSEFN